MTDDTEWTNVMLIAQLNNLARHAERVICAPFWKAAAARIRQCAELEAESEELAVAIRGAYSEAAVTYNHLDRCIGDLHKPEEQFAALETAWDEMLTYLDNTALWCAKNFDPQEEAMRKAVKEIRFESRQARFEMHRLVSGGLPIVDALKTVLPHDKNRKKKLKTWENNGLWPLSDQDLALYEEQAAEKSEGSDQTTPERPPAEISEPSESARPEPKRADDFTARQVQQIREIVRQEVDSVMSQRIEEHPSELPPTPAEKIKGDKGRPASPGERVKLAGTVDAELERLFREQCARRGMSVSRLLDTVLWHYFGRPRLSFETSDKSD